MIVHTQEEILPNLVGYIRALMKQKDERHGIVSFAQHDFLVSGFKGKKKTRMICISECFKEKSIHRFMILYLYAGYAEKHEDHENDDFLSPLGREIRDDLYAFFNEMPNGQIVGTA